MKKSYTPTRKTPKTNKAIGQFLIVKREKAKLSLRDAQDRTGIAFAVINRMERGNFRLSFPNAVIFSKLYEFSLDELALKAVQDNAGNII